MKELRHWVLIGLLGFLLGMQGLFAQFIHISQVEPREELKTPFLSQTVEYERKFIAKLKPVLDTNLQSRLNPRFFKPLPVTALPSESIEINRPFEFKPNPSQSKALSWKWNVIEGELVPEFTNYAIRKLDVENGLKSNGVSAMLIEENGTIWIGYEGGGLSCLKGKEIAHFEDFEGLNSNQISTIASHNGSIWIGTFGGGLFELNGKGLRHYSLQNGFLSDHLLEIKSDGKSLWMATYGSGILRFENGRFYAHQGDQPMIVNAMATNENGHAFFSGGPGEFLHVYQGRFEKYLLQGPDGKPILQEIASMDLWKQELDILLNDGMLIHLDSSLVTGSGHHQAARPSLVHRSRSGSVWLGNSKGMAQMERGPSLLSFSYMQGLSKSAIRSIADDDERNIWLGTDKDGIFIISASNFFTLFNARDEEFIAGSPLHASSDLVWMRSKNGIMSMDSKRGVKKYEHPALMIANGFASSGNALWISSMRGAMLLRNDSLIGFSSVEETADNSFLGVAVSGNKVIWSNYNWGLVTYNLETKAWELPTSKDLPTLSSNSFTDSKGRLWISSPSKGIMYLHGNQLHRLHQTNSEVFAYAEDEEGNIWAGTEKGLYRIDPELKLKLCQISNAKSSYEIRSIFIQSKRNTIWLGTQRGLVSVDLNNLRLQQHGKTYGINGSFFTPNAAVTLNGNQYWSTNLGLIEYLPYQFGRTQRKMQLFISSVSMDYHDTDWENLRQLEKVSFDSLINGVPQNLILPYWHEVFNIAISTRNWNKEESPAIYYRLDNRGGWLGPVTGNNLSLTRLDGGKHDVSFKAINQDGSDSTITTYSFEVAIPLYFQNWFLLLCTAVAVLMAFWFFRNSSRLSFENLKSYTILDNLSFRMRVMGFLQAVLLPLYEFLEQTMGLTSSSELDWMFLAFVSLCGFGEMAYSFRKASSLRTLVTVALYNAILTVAYILFRVKSTDYSPSLSIGFVVVFAFASMLFFETRTWVLFAGISALLCVAFSIGIDISNPNHLLFILNIPLGYTLAIVYHALRINSLSNTLFSDKVLKALDKLVVVMNDQKKAVYVNHHALKETGIPEEQLIGSDFWPLLGMNEADLAELQRHLEELQKQDSGSAVLETRLKLPGQEAQSIFSWEMQKIDQSYCLLMGSDVTKMRMQNEQVKMLSLIALRTEHHAIVIDVDGKIVWVNQSFCKHTGYELEEVAGRLPSSFLHGPMTDPEDIERIRNAIKKNESYAGEIVNYTKARQPYWVAMDMQPLVDENGKLNGYVVLETDVTGRKAEEVTLRKAMQESQQKYDLVAQNTSDGIAILNANGKFEFVTPAYCLISGHTQNEAPNHDLDGWLGIIHPEDLDNVRNLLAGQIDAAPTISYRIRHKESRWVWREDSITAVEGSSGRILRYFIVARDVTPRMQEAQERERMIKDLKQSNEELRRFSYIISHNLRAPVTNFIGLLTLLKSQHLEDNPNWPLFEALFKSAEKFDATIHDLNDFILLRDKLPEDIQDIKMEQAIQHAIKGMEAVEGWNDATLTVEIGQHPKLKFSKQYLEDILHQLLQNCLRYKHPERKLEIILSVYQEGDQACLSIKDNGLGLDMQTKGQQLFGLYQKFHDNSVGKGLSLFMAKAKIESLGGRIHAKGNAGEGFEIQIEFPAI